MNNQKILNILRYESGRSGESFFNFSSGVLQFLSFKEMNSHYLDELIRILQTDVLNIYNSLVDNMGNEKTKSADQKKKKVIATTIQEFCKIVKQNIFMISRVKNFYEGDLKKSLNIENVERAFVHKMDTNEVNLLTEAADALMVGNFGAFELSVEDSWSLKNKDPKKAYILETMEHNVLSHISGAILDILLNGLEAEDQQSEDTQHAILSINKHLRHLLEDLDDKIHETIGGDWQNNDFDTFSSVLPEFLEKGNLIKFLVKETLHTKIDEIRQFILRYRDKTFERTFFTIMMENTSVNKAKFKQYMALIKPFYSDANSIRVHLTESDH